LSIFFFHYDPLLDERLDVERPVDLDELDLERVVLFTALELRLELPLVDRTALELRLELPLDRPTLEDEPVDRPVELLPELRTVPLELLPLLPEERMVRPVERPVVPLLPPLLYILLDRVDEEDVLSQPDRAF
tara:strand:- start:469 stop:867 length:399 start_codon:yes stop_codon:yes gene_type:complete